MTQVARTISIGAQDFASIRENGYFYVDKTAFIREWWESGDVVTLITRPRRFGKTLNMSMLDYFFSDRYPGRGDLFEGLDIWKEEKFQKLQGTYPVISLSFAGVKYKDYKNTKSAINGMIADLYSKYGWILKDKKFMDKDREAFREINRQMEDSVAAMSLNMLCEWLYRYCGKKCILFLDEYDTPMQEAYLNGFWDELTAYIRALFNNTFKTNPYLERGIMTGIVAPSPLGSKIPRQVDEVGFPTRLERTSPSSQCQSVFSDLNNPNVVTTTSNEYAASFGFTEEEVFAAMDEQGIPEEEKVKVKEWYDGFSFGAVTDIYNPWSITMYLDKRKLAPHWANTSENGLVSRVIREGDRGIKSDFEKLLKGEWIEAKIDEQIIFSQLPQNRNAIWSLLLASGYLKVLCIMHKSEKDDPVYQLSLTNFEVKKMFNRMVRDWFEQTSDFGEFVSGMFQGDAAAMNYYMNRVALNTFSYFDAGSHPSEEKEPERFYHGFVLGLLVDKADSHIVKSNRESGYGRYDVVMEPKDQNGIAVIMEFKVLNRWTGEKTLEDTADNALKQIEEKMYDVDLLQRGISKDRIFKYGFAFEGEKCFIKKQHLSML